MAKTWSADPSLGYGLGQALLRGRCAAWFLTGEGLLRGGRLKQIMPRVPIVFTDAMTAILKLPQGFTTVSPLL